ncbi:MAG: type IIL restriction-modification enzyme MmeI [Chloroflexota bacterium]|nr:type IIL restriction-modification enzyme MmeI [Chloroflexota bacterium]
MDGREPAGSDHERRAQSGVRGVSIEHERTGDTFTFEKGVRKTDGGQGFADVWFNGHFAFEYKQRGKYKDLTEAYQQLQRYRENLENPPLLVVTDIANWEIHTNFTSTARKVYKFTHRQIAEPTTLRILNHLFHDSDRLRPDRDTVQVTREAAASFKAIADNMRSWEAEPERIAHFLTKLVFCLFAEDAGLLPRGMSGERGIFAEIVSETRHKPDDFVLYIQQLFRAMADGGAALVGDPDQFLAKIRRYMDMGIRAFIFSGYPHLDECEMFGRYVLPQLETVSLPQAQGRIPATLPPTPLGAGERR